VYEVDPEELGLVNYFEIVSEPMHLDLVASKLQVAVAVLVDVEICILTIFSSEKGVQNSWPLPP
jgi:hypothetical protein